jgi:O-antigen/teichoic acid export membrane protein
MGLVRYTMTYLLSRGIPGLIALGGLAAFTRILSPSEYGSYAIVVSGVSLANAVVFQWLRLSLVRFVPASAIQRGKLLSTILVAYLLLACATAVLGGLVYAVWPDRTAGLLLLLGLAVFWTQGWFELNLELARVHLKSIQYGVMMVVKSVVSTAIGGILAYAKWGGAGLLVGLLIGMAIPSCWALFRGDWREARCVGADRSVASRILRYGLPLSVAFAFSFVVSSSDRLLLGWFMGPEQAGLYAVGYDLPRWTVGTLLLAVNLAGYPLVVRAMEEKGVEAARQQWRKNGTALMGVGLPAAVGLAMVAPNAARMLLGADFQLTATALIPWIGIATFVAGMKEYFFDLSFHLSGHTVDQVWIVGCAALLNIGLNLWWIPWLGVMGAVYSTVAAYAAALVLSWTAGRRRLPVSMSMTDAVKIAAAAAGMAIALAPLRDWVGGIALIVQVVAGASTYAALLLLLNAGSSRKWLARFLAQLSPRRPLAK